ncbi:MAG: MltA domain-containing protein [Rhizobiaceae bacterium]|nr:MltA domain-containing protein [Rhizobiaceae bacterium]
MRKKPYTTKSLSISAADLAAIGTKALDISVSDNRSARGFFEDNFTPCRFNGSKYQGMLTGYYEPVLAASRTRTDKFRFPLLRRPDDLVDVMHSNRPQEMDEYFAFGRKTPGGIVEYYDRAHIGQGALDNKGLELFWLESPVDVFFIHIQGSARLLLDDNSSQRVSYAAKSGHPYTPIGKILIDKGELKIKDVTMQSIRKWLNDNPSKSDELMSHNRSYIFFKTTSAPDAHFGPIAAAGVPLTQNRSLAVDHKQHTFGTPIWVETDSPINSDKKPLSRLMIAQDTGSAIVGPQRGDYFCGSGDSAGEVAGRIKHAASMTLLVPNPDRRC